MQGYKLFSLDEARQLLPVLRQHLNEANDDLQQRLIVVQEANECYQQSEKNLDQSGTAQDVDEIRRLRGEFQDAIQNLSVAQNAYISRLNFWVEKITGYGVILRDLRDGLLDFPCQENGFEYFLCWRLNEDDINFWHLENDGFIGRKPLSALQEYC